HPTLEQRHICLRESMSSLICLHMRILQDAFAWHYEFRLTAEKKEEEQEKESGSANLKKRKLSDKTLQKDKHDFMLSKLDALKGRGYDETMVDFLVPVQRDEDINAPAHEVGLFPPRGDSQGSHQAVHRSRIRNERKHRLCQRPKAGISRF